MEDIGERYRRRIDEGDRRIDQLLEENARLRGRAERAEKALAAWVVVGSCEDLDAPPDIGRWARTFPRRTESAITMVRRVIAGLDAAPASVRRCPVLDANCPTRALCDLRGACFGSAPLSGEEGRP